MKIFVTLAVLLLLVLSSTANASDFSVKNEGGTLTVTCLQDSCKINSLSVDRNKRSGRIKVEMGMGVEDLNFGKRTYEQKLGEHVRVFDLDLATGSLISIQCSAPAMHVALVPSDYEKMCSEDFSPIFLNFSNKVSIRIPDILEVNINGGQAVFRSAP